MLSLTHFNLNRVYPRLDGEYVPVANTNNFKLERIDVKDRIYFLVSDSHGNSCGGSAVEEINDAERVRGSAYGSINRAMSYVMAAHADKTTRLALLAELVELTKLIAVQDAYSDMRIHARLEPSTDKIKMEPNPPVSENPTIIRATELWHVFPNWETPTIKAKYEDITLELSSYWGIEKVGVVLKLERGDHVLTRKLQIGFDDDYEPALTTAFTEFEGVANMIPHPAPDEEGDEHEKSETDA